MQRLKSKRTRVRKALKDLRLLNDIVGANQTSMAPVVADLLAELDEVINKDVPVDEPIVEGNPDDDSDADDDDNSVSAEEPAETGNVEVQQKIDELQEKLKQVDDEIRVNEKVFTNFSQAIKRTNNMLTKTRVAINASKAARKRSGNGIESQIFRWMKYLFRVQQPAYHGGKLIGGDCKLMMAHAH